ncbi:MAG: tryptophan--tRNA ligase [Thermoprotei archaeon]|nr:MAG: tryptophan--tRNA ligase [Thermoprotei archaeon]
MSIFGVSESSSLEKRTDYERLIKEFGLKPLDKSLLVKLQPLHYLFELGMIFAHRGFDDYLRRYEIGQKVSIVSGRGPSNFMHLGHLVVFEVVKWLQSRLNASVYIPLSDDEKYVFGKVKRLEDAHFFALDNALDILSLGFIKGKTFLYISSKMPEVYEISVKLSRYLTYNTVKATFGLDDSTNPGTIFYACVQAAHILMPTLLHGEVVVVPIAIDQDPYMRLTRDVAERVGIAKPAAIYSKYIKGLTGEPMSASKPETCIFTSDDPETVRKKVWMAFTGGRPTLKEQKELGGEPEKCVVFEWLKVFVFKHIKDIGLHEEKCRSGALVCGECKKMLSDALVKRLEEIKRNKMRIMDNIDDYFLHPIEEELIENVRRRLHIQESQA